MRKQRNLAATVIVVLVAVSGVILLPGFSTIMVVTDGCACGYQRTWYEMPDSLWHRKRFFMHVDKTGNPAHAHHFWDAQWGVWFELPWLK